VPALCTARLDPDLIKYPAVIRWREVQVMLPSAPAGYLSGRSQRRPLVSAFWHKPNPIIVIWLGPSIQDPKALSNRLPRYPTASSNGCSPTLRISILSKPPGSPVQHPLSGGQLPA